METDQIRRVLAGEKVVSLQHGGGEQAMQQYDELLVYVRRLEEMVVGLVKDLANLPAIESYCAKPKWLRSV